MAFTDPTFAVNNVQSLADQPTETAAVVKQTFDQASADIKTFLASHIDELESTTDGASGMDNIGMTPIDGVMTTPQQALEYLKGRVDATQPTINFNSILDYGAKCDGVTDDTQAWVDMHTALPLSGGKVTIPIGRSLITSHITFTKPIVIEGVITPSVTENIGSTIVTSAMGELTLLGEGSGVRDLFIDGQIGNTGNGINFSCARAWAINLTVLEQGQDGIVIGSETLEVSANNFNMINLKAKTNGRYGLLIKSKDGATKNTNAGVIVGLDSAGNQSDGLRIENSSNNTFIGLHCETNNGVDSYGLRCLDSDGNMFLSPYLENNTVNAIYFDSLSDENKVLGMRNGESVASVTDLGSMNMILGVERSKALFNFFQGQLLFQETGVSSPGISGYWTTAQNEITRALEYKFKGTSTTPVPVKFIHDNAGDISLETDWLRINEGSIIKRQVSQVRTLDFPSIAANSIAELDFTVTGAVVEDIVVASPNGILESGLVWSAYVAGANTTRIRIANVTTSSIDPVSRAWRVQITGY